MESETLPSTYRPVSGTEYSWHKAVPTGTGITVLALHLVRPIPLQNLQTALRNLQISHPVLSSTLTSTSLLPSPSPVTIRTNPLPPRVPSLSPFHSVLERELNLNPWASPDPIVPNFFATLYEQNLQPGDLPGSVLALRFHAAVCDRTSQVTILKELLEMVGGGDEEGYVGKGEVKLGIEESIKKEDAWKPFWARGKDLVGYSINGLRSAMLRFEETGTDQSSQVVRLVMNLQETQRLLHACKNKGVKLCAALAAAGLIATRSTKQLENSQPETYSLVTLVDCRKFLDPALTDHDIGFYHSAILNTHSVCGGDGLWEVAARCHDACSNARSNKKHLTDIGELNFLMCKAVDNPHVTPSSSLRTAVISVFEEPAFYESAELLDKLGVDDYVGCASVHGVGPSIAIFDVIRDGRLDCACVYPSPLHSRKQITELAEHMKQILTEGSLDAEETCLPHVEYLQYRHVEGKVPGLYFVST